uniref:Uncharacterized protein n=1 Tax=Ascaris lumbricoides TaxID=6252 RepID=A0A0M3HZ24_ASCLU
MVKRCGEFDLFDAKRNRRGDEQMVHDMAHISTYTDLGGGALPDMLPATAQALSAILPVLILPHPFPLFPPYYHPSPAPFLPLHLLADEDKPAPSTKRAE